MTNRRATGRLAGRAASGQARDERLAPRVVHWAQDHYAAIVERNGELFRVIDPTFVVTHILSLDDAPDAYELFKRKEDGCVKVVLKP